MTDTAHTTTICSECGASVLASARYCGMCGSPIVRPTPAAERYLGEIVAGRYEIERHLASGGMGEVYIAKHQTLDQKVAVKLLNPRFASDEKVVARFFNEARSYCRVKHPHAVGLLDFGRLNDGTLYIVTEFVEGTPLDDLVSEQGPLAPALVVRLATQIAEVLAAAHAERIIHRDLKPDNLIVTAAPGGRYTVKVLDFGIARILDDEQSRLTRTGSVFGTPEYMSPEQARGEDAGFPSDLYSLGAVLFFMLTGSPPFRSENRSDVLQRQISEPPPLGRLRDQEDLPPPMVSLIADLLSKGPKNRPADALAVLTRLESIAAVVPEPRPAPKSSTAPDSELDLPAATTDSEPSTGVRQERATSEAERLLDEEVASQDTLDEDIPGVETFELTGPGEPAGDQNDDDAFAWGGEADDQNDILKASLDVDPSEIPVTSLTHGGAAWAWMLVALLVVGGGIAFALLSGGDSESDGTTPEDGSGAATLSPGPGGTTLGSALGTGTTLGASPQSRLTANQAATQSDAGQAAPTPTTSPRASAQAVPSRTLDLIQGARQAGLAASYLREAEVNRAAEAWARARTLLTNGENTDAADALPIAQNLARAQELIAQARAALGERQCRQADRAIVAMREISPALRRSFLGDLNDCNRRRARDRGEPPRTLE